jgi:hypothetical protein
LTSTGKQFLIVGIAVAVVGAAVALNGQQSSNDQPRYTTDGRMLRPDNYREWIWLSSGIGMSYNPRPSTSGNDNPSFDNVFVNPTAYRSFLSTGKWPDKTILVLEARYSASNGSINRSGHFQTGLMAVEVHVKDEKRFPGKWAFFGFDEPDKPASMFPTSAACYSCHEQHGAVDTTFVQFYPTLLQIAKRKATMKQEY